MARVVCPWADETSGQDSYAQVACCLLCVAAQNLIEFWRVCTRPIDKNGLGLSPSEADRELTRLESLTVLLADSSAIYPEWRRITLAHGVSGVQVHDARLVAVMNLHGVRSIVTFNTKDFLRYPGLEVRHPAELSF